MTFSDKKPGIPDAPPIALAIAGFDPSSGAGITADLKTFAAHRIYGLSCATALTVQSTQGVRRVFPVDAEIVHETLLCLQDDIEVAGIKIGMLATAPVAQVVSSFLEQSKVVRAKIVLDPVLQSSSGAALLDEAGVSVMSELLLARVGWITPNVEELAVLVGAKSVNRETIPQAARQLREMAAAVGNTELRIVVTGGHLDRPDDYLLGAAGEETEAGRWIPGEQVDTRSTHGTGCAFSSALLCHSLLGASAFEAVLGAKQYVTEALRAAYPLGRGRGPMNHLYRFD